MFLSRITLDHKADALAVAQILRDEYRLHQSIWSLFTDHPDRERDFLYRLEHAQNTQIYALSDREPAGDTPWRIETRIFDPALKRGEGLRFRLRANPVVSRKGGDGKSRRHDVVMDLKKQSRSPQHVGNGNGTVQQRDLIQEAGFAWLARKAEASGFEVQPHQVACESYTQHRLNKKGREVRLSSIDFQGLITVTDPDLFREAVFRGIGPAKGFGMGLMLLRRD